MTCLRVWRGSCISQWRCGHTFGGGHAGECEASDICAAQSETTKAKVNQCINRTTRSTDEKTCDSHVRITCIIGIFIGQGRVLYIFSYVVNQYHASYSPTESASRVKEVVTLRVHPLCKPIGLVHPIPSVQTSTLFSQTPWWRKMTIEALWKNHLHKDIITIVVMTGEQTLNRRDGWPHSFRSQSHATWLGTVCRESSSRMSCYLQWTAFRHDRLWVRIRD